ncbi:squalene/phytoene synthase [Artemisia annua]|uniref:Squalene/phytoene synthase n=1 Tax=Artemisia annua TaxID=35608 RepID=A0A2U1PPF6_ARTAN|nr:squalene/phytoene synthase [Artemisia annua]
MKLRGTVKCSALIMDLFHGTKLMQKRKRVFILERQIAGDAHVLQKYSLGEYFHGHCFYFKPFKEILECETEALGQFGFFVSAAACRHSDTIEDDTSLDTMVKIPILMEFYDHIYDLYWHFECGTKQYKILMDQFHHVSTAFLELNGSYQEAIEDITMKMGAGMAKFICKEVDTLKDYDDYCHYVARLVGIGLSKLFHASGKKDMFPDPLSNSTGLFLQETMAGNTNVFAGHKNTLYFSNTCLT